MKDSADHRSRFRCETLKPANLEQKEKTMKKNTVSIALDPESLFDLPTVGYARYREHTVAMTMEMSMECFSDRSR
jgi:hypothetical protein